MRSVVCVVFAIGVLAAGATPAAAQGSERALSSISGLERRASQFERREEARVRKEVRSLLAEGKKQPEEVPAVTFFARVAPAIEATDSSTKFAPALHLVRQPDKGRGAVTFRAAFRTQRPRDLAKTRTTGGGVGADVQLTADDSPVVVIGSADFVKVVDGFELAAGTLEVDHNLTDNLTLIGAVAVAHLAPADGAAVDDLIPTLGLQISGLGKAGAALLTEYTFNNDVDGEDDYAVSVRFKLTEVSSLKVGTGKHGRVFASFVQVLR